MKENSQRRRPTLRGRVALLALGAIAGLLVILSAAFDIILTRHLSQQVDDGIRVRAQAVGSTVVVAADGAVSVRDAPDDRTLDNHVWVVAGSRFVEQPPRAQRLRAAVVDFVRSGDTFRTGPDEQRLYAEPVTRDGHRAATIVVSQSLGPYERAEHAFVLGSAIVAALLLAGSYPLLRLVTARAMKPVEVMTRQASEWSAHHPDERFGGNERYRELAELARTFDDLLDRITAVLRHERYLSTELSHELRTPVARIAAESDLLLARASSADERTGLLSIREAASTMTDTIETLIAAARSDLASARGRSEIDSVLRATTAQFAGPAIRTEVDPESLTVGVDPRLVQRMVTPVVENAVRHAATAVSISATRQNGQVVVEVDNDGESIGAALIDQIFEPGFSAGGGSGAGLGLPLARRLARSADGDVVCVPRSNGARFRITLPPG